MYLRMRAWKVECLKVNALSSSIHIHMHRWYVHTRWKWRKRTPSEHNHHYLKSFVRLSLFIHTQWPLTCTHILNTVLTYITVRTGAQPEPCKNSKTYPRLSFFFGKENQRACVFYGYEFPHNDGTQWHGACRVCIFSVSIDHGMGSSNSWKHSASRVAKMAPWRWFYSWWQWTGHMSHIEGTSVFSAHAISIGRLHAYFEKGIVFCSSSTQRANQFTMHIKSTSKDTSLAQRGGRRMKRMLDDSGIVFP